MGGKALQFPFKLADNYEMGPDPQSFPDEPHGMPGAGEVDQGLEWREPYLRRVLGEFEAGRLQAYEYTRRVLAINAASSIDEMQAIVDQLASGDIRPTLSRGFDAVDLARLRSSQVSESRSPNARYVTLALVFVLFAVLIGIGMWLATHVHGAALSSTVAVGPLRHVQVPSH